LVREGDLNQLSTKKIRLELEKEFHQNLADFKDIIETTALEYAQERLSNESLPPSKSSPDALETTKKDEEPLIERINTEQLSDYEIALALQKRENSSLRRRQQQRVKKPRVIKQQRRQNHPFTKPLLLSPSLSTFMNNAHEMSRVDVVKSLWNYIKENKLQDPNDKRFILCDDRLKTLFNQQRISGFKMNKYLSLHLYDKDEIV
jgi:chromatin remodeling complex protein RSC6